MDLTTFIQKLTLHNLDIYSKLKPYIINEVLDFKKLKTAIEKKNIGIYDIEVKVFNSLLKEIANILRKKNKSENDLIKLNIKLTSLKAIANIIL